MKENRHYKYISIKELISIAEIFNSISDEQVDRYRDIYQPEVVEGGVL